MGSYGYVDECRLLTRAPAFFDFGAGEKFACIVLSLFSRANFGMTRKLLGTYTMSTTVSVFAKKEHDIRPRSVSFILQSFLVGSQRDQEERRVMSLLRARSNRQMRLARDILIRVLKW